ncbi:hypothetical protein RM6536_1366 [Rothia mucilaginosa]|jgi:hypothetical protein|uniref:Uncharacterized protein n=1 Tax=Rothia mucilaginosa TaxID=43675 RepID=A0A0K2S0J7_9MICC|nr:hypothetical protein RM6536_1366 [Rothia mucilaginosa]
MNTTDNQKAINDFIDWVIEIKEFLCELLEAMYEELPVPKKKK